MSLITFLIAWFIISVPVTFFIAAIMGRVSNHDKQPTNLQRTTHTFPQVKSEPTQPENVAVTVKAVS